MERRRILWEHNFCILIALICGLVCLSIGSSDAKVLFRSTIEDYEGTLEEMGWAREWSNEGRVRKQLEDPTNPDYQKQAHGELSLFIYDPDNNSLANAKHEFPAFGMIPNHPAYMVEFYLWIPTEHESLGNCYAYYPTHAGDPADITITLEEYTGQQPDHVYVADVYVTDNNGTNNVKTLTGNEWHRFQVHKLENSSVINFYIDGDSIGTYTSMSGTGHPDTFLIGTVEEEQNGEGFWDDFIVTTPPTGEHPRLLFTEDDTTELRARKDNIYEQPFGTSYAALWNIIYDLASDSIFFGLCDSFPIPYATPSDSDTTIWLQYPFEIQPLRHPDTLVSSYWWQASEGIAVRALFLAFAYTMMPESTRYFERVKPILLGVGKWKQWADPDYKGGFYYFNFSTFWFPFGISLAYDMVFNELNNYERMSIQNTLLSLGLGQMWLERSYGSYGTIFTNGGSIFNSTMGLSALGVYDNPNTSIELDTAKTKLNEFWTSDSFCGNDGDYFEGVGYGGFASRYFEWFGSAYFHSTRDDSFLTIPFLGEFPTWLVYSYLPPDKVVNFNDCRDWYIQTESVSGALQRHNNKYGQWYLSKTVQQRIQEQHLGRQALAIFLEGRSDLDSISPDTLPKVKEFKTTGWVIMRKGWDENCWLSAFKSVSFNYEYSSSMAHLHRDNNNFIFGWKRDWWIGDPGYGMIGADRHNVILVDNPDAGSQIDKSGGKILRYGETEHYTFAEGDASDAHDSLGLWFRKIVMSKDDPLIVVMDRVEPEDGDTHKYYYLLQTSGKVNINGDTAGIYFEVGEDTLFAIPGFPDNMNVSTNTYENKDNLEWKRIIYESPLANTLCFLMLFSPSKESIFNFADESIMGTQTRDKVIIFGKGVEPLPMVEYKLIYTGVDSSFNFLVDLIPDTTYKVIVRDKDMNTLSMEELLSTDEGTLGFTVEMAEDTIVIFVGTDLISDTPLATAMNNQRKIYVDSNGNPSFVYKSGWKVFYDYSEDGGKTFDESTFGDGSFPALARNPDTTSESSCAAVWVNGYRIDFSRYIEEEGWSDPQHLVAIVGVEIHYSPPSLLIDDEGYGHLAWEKITEPLHYPGDITYTLHYSTFDAALDSPTIIEDNTLDSTTEYVEEWTYDSLVLGSASIDLDDDGNPVVAWSRAIGDGKHTVYLMQKSDGTWSAEPETVSVQGEVSIHPFCDIKSNNIHVVWDEEGVIKYRKRPLTGGWIDIETVSNTLLTSRSPQILNGNICVFTEEPQMQPDHCSNIVYRERSEEGNWGTSNMIISSSYLSEHPQSYMQEITPSGRIFHTVWTEGSYIPYRVKYKMLGLP